MAFSPRLIARHCRSWRLAASSSMGTMWSSWGPPGTGKTHLAIALGLKAVQQRYRTLLTSATSLIAAMTKAYAENRLEERLKH